MLTLIKHDCGVLELVEGPEPVDPYHYFAPWEEDRIQTRADGTTFVKHEGAIVEVETFDNGPGHQCYRALLGGSPA